MKRLHIHISVPDLEKSVIFYSTMFGAQPVKQKSDYAKWLLDDPRFNFAISTRSKKQGIDHLGIQVDEDSELSKIRDRLKQAKLKTFAEGETTCCYAEADKSWITDPAGVAWETYRIMADVEMFGADRKTDGAESEKACCAPHTENETVKDVVDQKKKSSYCG